MMNLEKFWRECNELFQLSMSIVQYELWIKQLKPVCIINGTLFLSTETNQTKKMCENRYLDLMLEDVQSLNNSIENIEIVLDKDVENFLKNNTVDERAFSKTRKKKPRVFAFDEKYTFENFIEGSSNNFALAACKNIASNPGGTYNPLFIYSGVGLGKTHLLHAIGNYITKNSPALDVLYVKTPDLITEVVNVIGSQNNATKEERTSLRDKYSSVDVLMIDDIQFLANKDACQEWLFNTFNELHESKKQLIFTSDRSPIELTDIDERLRSRLGWGIPVDIKAPDFETRVAILKNKAAQKHSHLPEEVAMYVAQHSNTNVRDLEGILNRVVFHSQLLNTAPTIEIAKLMFDNYNNEKNNTIDVSDIINEVANYFKVTSEDLFSKNRSKNIVQPRMIAIYLITELLPIPLVKIGEIFGGRDHTTILHARDKIADELKSNSPNSTIKTHIVVDDIKKKLLKR